MYDGVLPFGSSGFDNVVENTSGVWVSASEISVLEFFYGDC